jgi:hypothetical protein
MEALEAPPHPASQQLELVSFRGAWFYEGPSARTRSRNQHVFRVVTKDRDGLTGYCWIMIGTSWFHLRRANHAGAVGQLRWPDRNRKAAGNGGGFGDRIAVFAHGFQMHFDRTTDEFSRLFELRTANCASRKIWNIAVVASARFFADDHEVHRLK